MVTRDPAVVLAEVEALAAPILAAQGCEQVQIEFRREPVGWVLRLYVERLGHDPRVAIGGVDLGACARISREIAAALDLTPVIEHAYHLEVSSPGLERPLSTLAHYARFEGLPAKVVLRTKIDGQGVLVGPLAGVEGDRIAIDDRTLRRKVYVGFGDIARAHLVYVPEASPRRAAPKGASTRAVETKPRGAAEREQLDVENER